MDAKIVLRSAIYVCKVYKLHYRYVFTKKIRFDNVFDASIWHRQFYRTFTNYSNFNGSNDSWQSNRLIFSQHLQNIPSQLFIHVIMLCLFINIRQPRVSLSTTCRWRSTESSTKLAVLSPVLSLVGRFLYSPTCLWVRPAARRRYCRFVNY